MQGGPVSERFATDGEFVGEEKIKKLGDLPICELHFGRQAGVGRVRDLVHIVRDAPELGEQLGRKRSDRCDV